MKFPSWQNLIKSRCSSAQPLFYLLTLIKSYKPDILSILSLAAQSTISSMYSSLRSSQLSPGVRPMRSRNSLTRSTLDSVTFNFLCRIVLQREYGNMEAWAFKFKWVNNASYLILPSLMSFSYSYKANWLGGQTEPNRK